MKALLFLVLLCVATTLAQTKQPKTLRDFFNLLPQEYLPIEGCRGKSERDCEKARKEYLENYLVVEDKSNGYMKGGCDGAQSCFVMALFKRPTGSYIVGLNVWDAFSEKTYFLEYSNNTWKDIGKEIVPDYDIKRRSYELPRYGTTIHVYDLERDELGSRRGKRLYKLIWKSGKFVLRR